MSVIGLAVGIILLVIICAVLFNAVQRALAAWPLGEPWKSIIDVTLMLAALAIFVVIVIAVFGMFGIHVVIPGLHGV